MDSVGIAKNIAEIGRISAVPAILRVICELTGMRVALVARVTPDSWTACAVYDAMEFGLHVGDRLEVATTFCKEVCDSRRSIIIECASKDPLYATHPTPKLYQIESYIAIPILRPDGAVFGTLCAIDRLPANLDPNVLASLNLFAELISRQLRSEKERDDIEQSLWDERKISELREQFIAVLGHDLRTPLGGVSVASEMLMDQETRPNSIQLLRGIQESCELMSQLIDEVLDFARGRLGGGISVTRQRIDDVVVPVRQAVEELRRGHPDRVIKVAASNPLPVLVDDVRFRQLLANIIGNALQHSPPASPVDVKVDEADGLVRIAVTNAGNPIPPELLANLFTPFVRRPEGGRTAGLGLGLYIAAEIARSHSGSIHVESGPGRTTFTVVLPRAVDA